MSIKIQFAEFMGGREAISGRRDASELLRPKGSNAARQRLKGRHGSVLFVAPARLLTREINWASELCPRSLIVISCFALRIHGLIQHDSARSSGVL